MRNGVKIINHKRLQRAYKNIEYNTLIFAYTNLVEKKEIDEAVMIIKQTKNIL